ncbi:hypothetical protein K1I37_18915 [Alicyclobacillus acidoterrestris]|uniref:Uncharacterized protein n=1 Tax=Alicyclobacillus acidoterrestris (strain ATCC 49025 / DSM 3922 / CIP 106132 / NCIMB 13137 / GD3B) TaxID=1356854 RepID=T0DHX6_ALIAG|nr:hypothetical protein [Alicyclobacillus acidoterrestris]EPZ49166.1 hypothetical protein N007_21365 [Alicyclobacillus acidoterrestris ATCC 49025]UNO48700.1 hypothetical protein K1I37_18915 [Alicyclobacillus acidoterrestris]
MPGLGQLHIHRVLMASFALAWGIVFLYQSRLLEAVQFLFSGDIQKSTNVLNPEWLLFMPSVWGFAAYDSYINTVENNKLFEYEQRTFLRKNYQSRSFTIKKGKVIAE